MSLLDRLSPAESWERYYEYKLSLIGQQRFVKELRTFIDARGYLPVCERLRRGEPFPLPKKTVISKQGTAKKRVVYTYPPAENTVLKLLTYLILRRYDGLFCPNLYSFRPARTAKDAVRRLLRTPGIRGMHAYKLDIHDYFNSIPVPALTASLDAALADDPALAAFLRGLLEEPRVLDGGQIVTEAQKGIMAGTPISAFLANLYLKELDRVFYEAGIPYLRYSDDIIVFSEDREALAAYAREIRRFLTFKGLSVNPAKEAFFTPEEGWVFLGFAFKDGKVDIAPATLTKLKQKMRRKARALKRWQERNGLEGEKAARSFIRIFNRKLLEAPQDNDLSWSRWFFPLINTTESLHEIDLYAQDCLRFLISGKRSKSRYNVRYEELKKLGYRSLVHAYYEYTKEKEPE